MLSLPFLQSLQARAPLTEKRILRILRTADCTVSYRFEAVFAVDGSGQHSYLCHQAQLATMTVQQFKQALKLALSFRLPEPGQVEDPFGGNSHNALRSGVAAPAGAQARLSSSPLA